jgi:tricorn protease
MLPDWQQVERRTERMGKTGRSARADLCQNWPSLFLPWINPAMPVSRLLAVLLLSCSACAVAAAPPGAKAPPVAATTPAAVATPGAYFRYPAIRGDTVVFTSEGDLWKVGLAGGAAQRLTTHPGSETNASISRDGKWIAFSGSYEGAQEAYVMPVGGGLPKRISFDNAVVNVLGWTAQGEVLYSVQNNTGPSAHRIVVAVEPGSMARRTFPVADANDAVLDDSGRTLYFTRYGLAMTNDNVRHYRGGAYAQLWKYDLGGKAEAVRLFAGAQDNNKRPMWWNGKLYFISDRGGADNLWTADADGGNPRALTAHADWDVRNASLGDGRIAYQLGADLHVLDLAGMQDRRLDIELVSDFDQQRARLIRSPLDNLTNVQMSNFDERLILTARGRVTIAGTGTQRRAEIAVPEGSRAREAVFSHDDKYVFAIVDTTGENEIWRFRADGAGPGEQLTTNGDSHRWQLYPSPDGKWLAHTDKRGRFWLLDLATRHSTLVDDAGKTGVDRYEEVLWSPDSRTLAIVREASDAQRAQIGLYSLDSRKLVFVTSDRYPSRSPAFSPDGKWLYFLSERNFQLSNGSPWGDRNMGPVFDKRTGIYALALQPGNRFPFKPDDELLKAAEKGNDKPADKPAEKPADRPAESRPAEKPVAPGGAADVAATPSDKAKEQAGKDGKPAAPAAKGLPAIVFDGLADRLYAVPLPAGTYSALNVDDKRLYFLEREGPGNRVSMKTLAISKASPQVETFGTNIREYDLSRDKKRIYYRAFGTGAGEMYITDVATKLPADQSRGRVIVDDWTFKSSPRREWKQMFYDAWRMHRDFLYDANMRGVNWVKVRDKYAPLVDRVTDRAELNDILGMMVGEVGALHSQVRPGDIRKPASEGVPAGLGAILTRVADGWRVDHIYRSEPELPTERGPLAQADTDVRDGDVITAVNGRPAAEARDIADLLLNQAGKQVLLHVRRGQGAARPMIVTPVTLEKQSALRYSDWEQERAARVAKASDGHIGYLHLRAMGSNDIAAFAREFYANINRDGLIIDVRRNNGGNIDSWIIEKLLRKAWAFWSAPMRTPAPNMQNTFRGHLVVLVDELTYSDGETFAAGVKALKLGPLVGKRTAGAGVWLSDGNKLSDDGQVRVAETGQFLPDGQWLIEGVGVTPDVEVDNPPAATFAGADRQLEVALEMLRKKLKDEPVKPYKPQPIPAFQREKDEPRQ